MATYETILSIGAQLQASFGAVFSQLKGEFNAAKDSAKGFEGGVKESTDKAAVSLAGLKGKLMGAAVGAGFVAAGKKAVDLASDMEQLTTAMTVHLKSADAAKSMITDIQAFAKESAAFSFPDIAHASKQMLAYGFSAKEVIPQIRTLTDVASGLEIPLGDLTYLYGTLKAQGQAQVKDIQQFTNRGIPMWEALAEVMARTNKEYTIGKGKNAYEISGEDVKKAGVIQQLVSSHQVGFEETKQAFELMTAEGGKFYQMGEKQGETFAGRFNTMKDSIDQLLVVLGSPLVDVFGNALKALNDSGAINAIAAGLSEMAKHMNVIAPIAGTLAVAFTAMMVVEKVALGIQLMGAAMAGAKAAMIVFNAVMLANPIGLIVLGVATLVTAIALLIANWDKVTAAATGAFEAMKKVIGISKQTPEEIEATKKFAEAKKVGGGRVDQAPKRSNYLSDADYQKAMDRHNQRAPQPTRPPTISPELNKAIDVVKTPELTQAVEATPVQQIAKAVEAAPAPPAPQAAPQIAKAIESTPQLAQAVAAAPAPPSAPPAPAPAAPTSADLATSMEAYTKAMDVAKAAPVISPEVNTAELDLAKNTVDSLATTSVPNLNVAVSGVGSSFSGWQVPPTLLAQMDQVVTKANEVKSAMSNLSMPSMPSAGPAVGGAQFGGLVSRPGLWRLAEKGIPEMVIPMQQNQRSIGLLAQAANELGVGGGKGQATSSPMNVSVSIPVTVNGAPAGQEGAMGREIERAMQDPVRVMLEQLRKARDEEHRTSYV